MRRAGVGVRSRSTGLLLPILIAAVSASCARDEAADLETGSEAADTTTYASSADGGTASEADRDASPFRNFPLPPDPAAGGDVERHPVRIVNAGSVTTIVRASAGAAPVVLDTLEPGGAHRVDLEAPAGLLRIEWRSLDGRVSGHARVIPASTLLADSIWVVRIEADRGID
jgi:hypothetical protein